MTEAEIIEALNACPKGANVKLAFERPAKLRAAYKGMPLFKRSLMTIRVGVPHDKRKDVVEARANGDLPAENAGLLGVNWIMAPFLLRADKTGKVQLRVEPSINAKEHPKSEYFIREAGIETPINKDEYKHIMLGSEYTISKREGCFNLGIEGISRLHDYYAAEVEAETEAEAEAAN